MQTVHWNRPRCEAGWCMHPTTRLELRRTVLGAFWESYCDLHTSEAEYGPSTLLAVELVKVEVAV